MSYNDAVLRQATSSKCGLDDVQTHFLRWFEANGGQLDGRCVLAQYVTMGIGMIAKEAIENDEVLFSIPRTMLLNVQNSRLPSLAREYDEVNNVAGPRWDDVNVGWQGLIMSMMWEQFRASSDGSQACAGYADGRLDWSAYLATLPSHFDTPMFWSEEDLSELQGTSIPEKIGKQDATDGYTSMVRPYILARPRLFFGDLNDTDADVVATLVERHYSLQQFHIMGSRILSRSFHVKGSEGVDDHLDLSRNDEIVRDDSNSEPDSDDDDGEEEEAIENVSMVPMADILNARFGLDNARLYYKPDTLEMRASRPIAAGEQIWNTYGEPPSGDLLRRYGYVDLGNPSDVVELHVDDLIQARLGLPHAPTREQLVERASWACELGVEEVSPLVYPFAPSTQPPYAADLSNVSKVELRSAATEIAEDALVLARLFCLNDGDYARAVVKERLPKGRIDAVEEVTGSTSSLYVARLLLDALDVRMQSYATSIQDDEAALFNLPSAANNISLNKRNAICVRLSEKRILYDTKIVLQAALSAIELKRRQDNNDETSHKSNKKSR